jgi:hypothetical protein
MIFAAPFLLAGFLAIAVPVTLHLMARQVPKTIHFPSLRFITRDKLETQSKRGIRDFFLLLMRCLIIAAIVLAFAKPFMEEEQEVGVVSDKEIVVLLDASVSMNRKGALVEIQKKLKEMISDDESVALIVSGSGVLGRFPATDKDSFFKQLLDVKMSTQEGHHEGALNDALGLFNKTSKQKKLIIVSDFRQNDWNFSQTPQVVKEIDMKFLNPFESSSIDNVSVSVNRVRRMNAGALVQLQALLHNQSNQEKEVDVAFTAAEKVITEKVKLKALEKKRIVLTMKNPKASKASVAITADDYPFDDTYHIWIGEEAPINIAFLESGQQNSIDFTFVKKALQEIKSGDASFRVTAVDADLFDRSELKNFQVVILTDKALSLPAEQYEGFKEFVEEGGLLIAAPAEKAGVIISRLKSYGLADVTFEKKITRSSRSALPFHLEYSLENSPLLKLFVNTPDSDLQNFSIYEYNFMKIDGVAQNILGFSEDAPAWIINPTGQGNVLISAIPFNHIWSDFTLSNSFLPLLRQSIISLAGSSENAIMNLKIGEKKLKPGTEDLLEAEFVKTSQAGCQVINETPIVVNVSRQESQTEEVNLIDLKNRLRAAKSGQVNIIQEQQAGTEYWHLFIVLAILAMFAEFAIADLFRKGDVKKS